tara:strand:- start:185 stop:310 length:126 start_codon:yes stop_codon:yes gene_type:complete
MTKQDISKRIIKLKLETQTLESKKEIQKLQQSLDIDVVTEK